jgi:hypothetical protein
MPFSPLAALMIFSAKLGGISFERLKLAQLSHRKPA